MEVKIAIIILRLRFRYIQQGCVNFNRIYTKRESKGMKEK